MAARAAESPRGTVTGVFPISAEREGAFRFLENAAVSHTAVTEAAMEASAVLQRLLEFLEIRLIGVADGIDTFARHSTLTFGLKSLVSTIYLSDLRDKTIRGLEGRALAGFATAVCRSAIAFEKRSDRTARARGRGSRSSRSARPSFGGSSVCTSKLVRSRQSRRC
jgi:hypothetical protein